jgi:hypothetical protein
VSDVKLRIAVPCFGGLIQAVCAHSIMRLTKELQTLGTSYELDFELHESLVQRARNSLTHRFMKSDCTHMLFIDADIQFRPVDVLGLLQADKEMVCGAYPRKRIMEDNVAAAVRRGEKDPFAHAASFVVNVLPGEPGSKEVTLHADNGCVPILDAATGFLLTKRDVFIKMAAAMPEILYYSDSQQNRGEAIHAFFDCAIVDGRYLSEDYLFSRRWQNLGGTVWLFLPAELGHVGTYTYRGNLYSTFLPVGDDGAVIAPASSVAPGGGATEWCDIPSLPDSDPQKAWHLDRYKWAASKLRGLNVANAACGTNYGAKILLDGVQGRRVTGIDRSVEAAAIAKERHGMHIMHTDDLHHCGLAGHDALVSLETIEHLERPWEWLGRLEPSVRELILSVPIIPTKHTNPFHLWDFTETEVMRRVEGMGWRITDYMHQGEFVSNAVLLLRAER